MVHLLHRLRGVDAPVRRCVKSVLLPTESLLRHLLRIFLADVYKRDVIHKTGST